MALLKRIVTVIALVYLLLALLVLFFPSVTSSFSIFAAAEAGIMRDFTWASVAVVGLLLVFENLDSGLLRRNVTQQERKINELKAQLFDAKKTTVSPSPGIAPVNPAAYDAPVPGSSTTY